MPTYSIQHLAFVSIASLLAGLLLSSVYHYITKRQWEKQWDWVRSHSITKITAADGDICCGWDCDVNTDDGGVCAVCLAEAVCARCCRQL